MNTQFLWLIISQLTHDICDDDNSLVEDDIDNEMDDTVERGIETY